MRYKPKPPSFNKIPAKIIDPTTEASTWAFGNQKCSKYIGLLTKKIPKIQTIILVCEGIILFNKFQKLYLLKHIIKIIKKGNEKITIYTNK